MHIPVLIAGFVLGGKYGLAIGFILPLLRSLIFTMPPMFPIAIAMAFELGIYGLVTGLLFNKLSKNTVNIYISLVIAMIVGRLVWGAVSYFLFALNNTGFTWQMFMAGAFFNASIGIIIQLIIIPLIVTALFKSGGLSYE